MNGRLLLEDATIPSNDLDVGGFYCYQACRVPLLSFKQALKTGAWVVSHHSVKPTEKVYYGWFSARPLFVDPFGKLSAPMTKLAQSPIGPMWRQSGHI